MARKEALVEVFRTMNGVVYQNNHKYTFVIEWYGEQTSFKIPCYFSFKKAIDAINLEHMICDIGSSHDFEIVSPCGCERCYVLTIPEILEFKNLLSGAKVMMELNSIIHERLHRPVFAV